jgi:hypothetical protein
VGVNVSLGSECVLDVDPAQTQSDQVGQFEPFASVHDFSVKWTKERAVVAVVAVVFFLKAKPQRCIKKQDDACPAW